MHILKPQAQAETECNADLSAAASNEPRSVLPSNATVSPFSERAISRVQDSNAA